MQIKRRQTKEQLIKDLTNGDDYFKETINKMLEIQETLLFNPPKDKRFNNHSSNYLIEYINIINNVEIYGYSDEYLKGSVNRLHEQIFKNRRY